MKMLVTILCLLMMAYAADGAALNLKELGAVGDGKADDTEAIQQAFSKLASPDAGKLIIPAGQYRITRTLQFGDESSRSIVVEGEGAKSKLLWDGAKGGTLLEVNGMGHSEIRDLCLDGQNKAGILFNAISGRSGNHINRLSNILFLGAEAGVQMGRARGGICNADYAFTHIFACNLGTFFRVVNDQGVDYLFNFLFALGCEKVFDFQRGGNLTVNNAQMTKCGLFLNIEGGGRNAGTYICTNIRHEEARKPEDGRDQLLKATNIVWEQAVVKFIGFNDAQWTWFSYNSTERWRPLCEIGGGVNVTFESSIFNGPVALINGVESKPGSLVVRESTFGFILPHQAIRAGRYGYFKVENCFTDFMVPLPNMIKWPELPTVKVNANEPFEFTELPTPVHNADEAIEALNKEREAWVKGLKDQEEH